MHGDRVPTIYHVSFILLVAAPWLICRSKKALLETKQCGFWRIFVKGNGEMQLTDLSSWKTRLRNVKRRSAVQYSKKMKKGESWMLHVWRSQSTDKKLPIELWRRLSMMRCLLLIFFMLMWKLCAESKAVLSGSRRRKDEKGESELLHVWRS